MTLIAGEQLGEAWNEAAEQLNEIPLVLERVRYAAVLKSILALPEDAAILEAGCGAGRVLRTLDALGYHNVTGLEISQRRLEEVKRTGRTRATLVCSDHVPFEDGQFDAVVSAAVIEHVPDPRAWLTELARVVKPGGIVSITSDTYVWAWMKRLGLYRSIQPIDDAIWPSTLIGYAEAAGLSLSGCGGFVNVPEQRWHFAKELRRLVSVRRWVHKLTGLRTRGQRPYPAYEWLDETPGILEALDQFPLSGEANLLDAIFSYESYFYFRKAGSAAAAGAPVAATAERHTSEEPYRAAA